MPHTSKTLPESQIELTITVKPADYQKHLLKSAEQISQRASIHGFRPGKAPYDIVKREVGDMKILEESLHNIIQESFYTAITEEKLDTIGMPEIKVQKLAPDNEVIYTATVALLPRVKLAELADIVVKREPKPVTDNQINEVLSNLQKLQAREIIKNNAATVNDIAVVDMDMFLEHVPVEGGQSKDYRVYLSEAHYIPGFNQELIGLKKDESKKFSIKFPTNHYQKHLAGKEVEVEVKVKGVYERQMPDLSEEFAKSLGQDSIEKLKELLRANLTNEAVQNAEQRAEIEIFDKLIEHSEFGELPKVLVDAELRKMFYELTRDLERRGISIEKYLEDIKKSKDDLHNDFRHQAIRRAKAALLSRHIAKQEDITVSDSEVGEELTAMEKVYHDNPEHLEQLKHPDVRSTIKNMLQNKKVIAWLKEKILI